MVSYRYQHQDGGSNGSSQRFVIVCESRYGEDRYAGILNNRLASILECETVARIRENYKKTVNA